VTMQLHRNPDFDQVATAALPLAFAIAYRVAPPPADGKRVGGNYLWRNRTRDDRSLGSASLHLGTGAWADFALPDDPQARGHGITSWVAYLYGIAPESAERWLGGLLGLCLVDPEAPPEFAPLTDAEREFSDRVQALVEDQAPAWSAAEIPSSRGGLEKLYTLLRRQHGSPSHTYEYRRADGSPVALVLRWDTPGGKVCRPAIYARPAEDPAAPLRWVPAWPGSLPLFGADLLARRPQDPVLVFEGEKACLAGRELFRDWVCVAVGGNLHGRADWSILASRTVVVWPDHDQAGYRNAETVRQRAAAAGATSVSVVPLPDHLPLGWDVADPLPPGWTSANLVRLVTSARGQRRRGPDLSLLDTSRRAVPAIEDVLPSWSRWIDRATRAKSVPADYVVGALLGAASGMLGGRFWLEVRAGWTEPGVVNVVLVGDSAAGKTPAMETVEVGIEALEHALAAQYEAERSAHAADPEAKPEEKPHLHRCRIEDTSVEAAAFLLAREGRGLLGWQPEMTAWISGLTRYRQGGSNDRGFWLKAYDAKPYAVDRRKLDDPLMIPTLAIPLLGGLQPDLVPQLLQGPVDDGLGARFLLVWPDPVTETVDPVTEPEWREAEAFVARALSRLYVAASNQVEIQALTGREQAVLKLSAGAETRFATWHRDFLAEQRQRFGLALPGFVGKAPGHVVRLALLLHCLEWAAGTDARIPSTVTEATLATAIDLRCGFFEAHRERAELDAGEPRPERLARSLARYLVESGTELIETDVLRRHVRLPGLRTEARLRQALLELAAAGWLASGVNIPRQDRDPLPATIPLRSGLLAVAAGRFA
jgi:hypothetical protein